MSQSDHDEDQSPSEPPSVPSGGPRRLLPEAPRRFPEGLSGTLVKSFAKVGGIGMAIALVLLLVGLFLEDSYRELQEMRYFGEYLEAIAGNPLSDEDGEWATVVYSYGGQQYQAEVDLTEATYTEIASAPSAMATIPIVIWPEEPGEAVSVAWIDAQGGFLEFAWAYWLGIVVLVVSMLLATVRALRMRRPFVKGHEVWGTLVDDVSYDAQKHLYSATVRFDRDVGGSDAGTASWARAVDPVVDDARRMLLLVDAARPERPYVISRRELEAIQTGG